MSVRAPLGRLRKGLACAALFGLAACSRQDGSNEPAAERTEERAPEERTPEERSAALRWLEELEEAHREADMASDDAARRAALGRLAELDQRAPAAPAAELIELRQDLAVRAARLELQLGRPEAALAWAQRGLELSPGPSVMAATLWLTSADAHEAAGRLDETRAALSKALTINKRLFERELGEP